MGERLRGVEQVGWPAAPTPIPASEATPIALRKAAPEVLARAEEWLYYENELPPETVKRLVRDLAATLRAEMKGWASARGEAVDHSLRADELEAIVRALATTEPAEGGNHDGPCINYAGQDPADFDVYDSCARHIEASDSRRTAVVNVAVRAKAWVEANPEATGG